MWGVAGVVWNDVKTIFNSVFRLSASTLLVGEMEMEMGG